VGRKFSRASSARVDREGSFELQGCLAEAWLVKEAAAILLASWIPDCRSPLKSVNLHTWLYALSHTIDYMCYTDSVNPDLDG